MNWTVQLAASKDSTVLFTAIEEVQAETQAEAANTAIEQFADTYEFSDDEILAVLVSPSEPTAETSRAAHDTLKQKFAAHTLCYHMGWNEKTTREDCQAFAAFARGHHDPSISKHADFWRDIAPFHKPAAQGGGMTPEGQQQLEEQRREHNAGKDTTR